MKSQALLTVWCNISGGAGGEIWHWSPSGVKGLMCLHWSIYRGIELWWNCKPKSGCIAFLQSHYVGRKLTWLQYINSTFEREREGIYLWRQISHTNLWTPSSVFFLIFVVSSVGREMDFRCCCVMTDWKGSAWSSGPSWQHEKCHPHGKARRGHQSLIGMGKNDEQKKP